MTNPDYTALAFLVDRSGSMSAIADDAKGGMATLLKEQRALPGKCTVRISQFDDTYEVVCESTPVADVTDPDLVPRGMTALMDGWGKLMTQFGEELAALPEDERPANVIFVVITDGMENASKDWTLDMINAKVKEQQDKYGWQFLFLAANQDAMKTGATYGVAGGQTMTFDYSGAGAQAAYGATSSVIANTRTTGQKAVLTPDE